jgi:hypothetical protein
MNTKSGISKINKSGTLLVFPIKNAKEPDSLWSQFFPKKNMTWDWSDESDNKVADLWHLMKRLSDCRKVIYSKWYQGRATFFSVELFTALLTNVESFEVASELTPQARTVLDILEMDSPLSTRDLKDRSDLKGKFNEGIYNRAMKELFSRFLIVGFGEVDDGAFPSLAVGATKSLYEDIWNKSKSLRSADAQACIDKFMPLDSKFRKYLDRIKNK